MLVFTRKFACTHCKNYFILNIFSWNSLHKKEKEEKKKRKKERAREKEKERKSAVPDLFY